VPEHDGEVAAIQLTVHDVEIRAADCAGRDAQEHLVAAGLGHQTQLLGQGRAALTENHRPVGGGANFRHRRR
jgi:hypothetical protein